MKFEFHPDGLAELEAAADYYAERQPGLELRFIDAVDHAIHRIRTAPRSWRLFDGEIRRVLVHVSPYAVLYSIEPDRVYIIAVMHSSRKPGYWKDRMR